MPWLSIHPKWNELNHSLTNLSPPWAPRMDEHPWLFRHIWMWGWSGWGPMIISTYSDVRMVWMRTHDSFDIFGCEDILDDNPWFFRHNQMWGRSGWQPMILSTYSDVRNVWMTTHDSFDIFGCEDGLDDDPWFFWHIRMWGRSGWRPMILRHIRMWGRSGWRPMILSTYSDVRMLWKCCGQGQGSYNKISIFQNSSYNKNRPIVCLGAYKIPEIQLLYSIIWI
jgi:hypothetical protein